MVRDAHPTWLGFNQASRSNKSTLQRIRRTAVLAGAVLTALTAGQALAESGLLLYTPNLDTDNVSVYTTNADGTLTSTSTPGVGNGPVDAAVRGDQAFAYVTNVNADTLSVIDTSNHTVVQTIGTGDAPRGVAVSPDGSRVYVANNNNSNTVSVFSADALTGQLSLSTTIATGAGSKPRRVVFSQDGSRAYIANQGSAGNNGSVSIVNTATNAIIGTVATGGQLLNMAINPAGTRIYVTSSTNVVFVINTVSQSVIASPATGNLPFGVAVSPDGAYYYITNNNDHTIQQYDAASNTTIGAPVASAFSPRAPAISPDGNYLYVAQNTSANVSVFSVTAGTGVLTANGTIAAGTSPESVGMCGNGNAMLGSGGTFVANTAGALGCTGSSGPSFTGGTLRINGAGLAISTPMTLGSAGGTIDTNGNSATLSGLVSGSGGLTKSGTGTLTLSGVNTYTGGTAINAGILSVGADNNLGGAGGLAFGGGTLQYSNGFSSSRAVTLNAGGGTIDTNGNSATLSGIIGGTGSLTKSGTGTLTLSGANTYSGGTTVNAGTLSGTTTSLQGNIANNAAVTFDQTSNGTYAGAMSGTGLVTKAGAGTLTLSGANTYSGGTTVNAGTLSGSTTSLQGNIANNAAVTFDQITDGSYAGVLSGTGSVTKAGAGTVTLSGANTYSGGTMLNGGILSVGADNNLGGAGGLAFGGGTLQYANGFSSSRAVTLNAGGGTIDTNGNSATLSGIIGGTGSLTKSGAGTLTLSGANTYSGGTTVNAGTLSGDTTSLQGAITNNATVTFDQSANGTYAGIMSGTGGLTKSGAGTLTLSGINTYSGGTTINQGTLSGDTSSVQGAITNNATVIFDQATDGTYAGAISGTGGLTKNGTGKTILSGANTYTGDTYINSGILSVNSSIASNALVNSGGTLGGSGTIGGNVSVASGGIIAPGNSPGILTVNSLTLASGSITRMEINGLTAGTEYDQIVVNNTATLGGTLDLVFGFNPVVGNRFTLIKAANIVPGFAAIQDNISANFGAALQLKTIASPTAFDVLINQGSFMPFALTHNQWSVASMLDAQYAAWGATGLINRLDTLSAAQLPAVLASLSGEQHAHGQFMARRAGMQFNDLLLSRLDDVDGERAHGWHFWLKGLGGFGSVDGDGNAGRADNHSGGFALGADTELGDHAVLGAAAGYARSHVDAVTANLGMDSYQLSSYAKWQRDGNYIKGTVVGGFHQTDSRRTVFENNASADYDSTTAGTALEAGRNIALLETATLTPYAGLQYLHLNRDGFTETGSDLANLNVREANEDSFRTLLGARLSQIVKAGWGVSIQPMLHAAWVRENADRFSRLSADFAAAPATAYGVDGPKLERNRAAVGADLVTHFSETAQLNVAYNAELAKSDNWHTLSATFEYRW
ncbi:MAG: autotransporter-associated beta strand repeat-containing protein [Methylobacter sp.]|nr:autotransporter-associated beta strand repeat-containing protein [Methylobacter sp.]